MPRATLEQSSIAALLLRRQAQELDAFGNVQAVLGERGGYLAEVTFGAVASKYTVSWDETIPSSTLAEYGLLVNNLASGVTAAFGSYRGLSLVYSIIKTRVNAANPMAVDISMVEPDGTQHTYPIQVPGEPSWGIVFSLADYVAARTGPG